MTRPGKALKSGKTYLVASTPEPARAVYVFASDHPDVSKAGIEIMCEVKPESQFQGGHRRRTATRSPADAKGAAEWTGSSWEIR